MKQRWLLAAVGTLVAGALLFALVSRGKIDLPSGIDLPGKTDLKPMGAGLYWLGDPEASLPFIDHAVLSTEWENLEPRDDDFSGAGWDAIDKTMEAYPNYQFRLRITTGQRAPDWVKSVDGGCIGVTHPESGERACVPRFWTDAYLDEYEELMSEVARRYDNKPRILDVVNSACMTIWAEPFIRAGDDEGSNRRLWAAGLNEETDRYCLERSTYDMARVFTNTRISLATHNQWQIVVADGIDPSWEKERTLLEDLRAELGEKLVIQNNGLGGDDGCEAGEPDADMWCWLSEVSPPKGMQTEGRNKLELEGFTVEDAIVQALDLGACFVEHHQFGDDPARVRALDAQLKENC
jgi:hypothetical protein